MGYCYGRNEKGRMVLICDVCGALGARKYKCPFGWCQPIAACPKCHKEHKDIFSKDKHREQGCEAAHLDFVKREEQEAGLLAAGKFVRCSAIQEDSGLVRVTFRNQARTEKNYLMNPDTYHAIAILQPSTVEDFQKFGPIAAA